MSRRDMQSFWSLLADLARELSWPARVGLFGGMALGLVVGVLLALRVPPDEWHRGVARILVVFVLGTLALGAFLGLAAGVCFELLLGKGEEKGKGRKR